MGKAIRIGTRDSRLALWQANQVSDFLVSAGHTVGIVHIKTDGEIHTEVPLYETGIQGIFTKALDMALLNNEIDVAVHSLKDVPTRVAKGLSIAAVMKRENPLDVLVCRNNDCLEEIRNGQSYRIATGSIRRKEQWLSRYPGTTFENLRGNIDTRLKKLHQSDWQGAIFAFAALQRLGLTEKETGPQLLLDWMLSAPAQGAVAIVCRDEEEIKHTCKGMNDRDTNTCTWIEREFLRLMQGGCSSPIGALATIDNDAVHFKGNIIEPNGTSISASIIAKKEEYARIAQHAVQQIQSKRQIPA